MLKLCNIRARYIDQWSVALDDSILDEGSHTEMVVLHSDTLKIAPGEDDGSKVLINLLQKRFGGRVVETSGADILITPITVDTHIVIHVAFSSGGKGFDGKDFTFFHTLIGLSLVEGDLLASMDMVAENIVASDVTNCFDRDDLAIKLNFVALHHFLDILTDVVHASIDASLFQSSIGGRLGSCEQVVVDWIGSHSECAVNNSAVDMNTEVDTQDIIILENNLFASRIGSPVSGDIVQAESGWKSHTAFEGVSSLKTLVANEGSHAFLDLISKVAHRNTWLGDSLHILTNLTMDFGGLAIVVEILIIHILQGSKMTDLLRCGALKVIILNGIFDNLAVREWLIMEDISERDSGRSGLLSSDRLLFLLLIVLSLLLFAYRG